MRLAKTDTTPNCILCRVEENGETKFIKAIPCGNAAKTVDQLITKKPEKTEQENDEEAKNNMNLNPNGCLF